MYVGCKPKLSVNPDPTREEGITNARRSCSSQPSQRTVTPVAVEYSNQQPPAKSRTPLSSQAIDSLYTLEAIFLKLLRFSKKLSVLL